MSATLVAVLVIAVSTAIGVASAEAVSAIGYRLLNAVQGGEKSILRTLGGVIGFGCGAAAVQTGNQLAGFYGPPLAMLWVAAVFLVLIGAGKLLYAFFR